MRVFNGFQLVVGFALAPFGISWLADQSFKGSTAAFYAACVLYFVYFIFMWISSTMAMNVKNWNNW